MSTEGARKAQAELEEEEEEEEEEVESGAISHCGPKNPEKQEQESPALTPFEWHLPIETMEELEAA